MVSLVHFLFGIRPNPQSMMDILQGQIGFFQMVFVATAASIVSGAVAERVKLTSFLVFVVILTGLIYPIQMGWQWGGGWLAAAGFSDFAGSTLVHATGAAAALAGAIVLGPRLGRFASKTDKPMPGFANSSIPLNPGVGV